MEYEFIKSEEQSEKIKGMTVFNTAQVDTKKQPMFFGQPLGIQRYDSYKYPVFEKLTTQQLSYFWRPEEVSLQKDRGDYQTLRPEQKHIYTSNLKYQIMLDSVQGRGPGMAFLPYCSLPELEACMTVWEFMEMIHSRSYTYIIKNVYSDPAEILDTIISDQRILERAESVTESYDDFIQSAQSYGTSESWKHRLEGVHYAKENLMMLNENSTEQSQTLIFLKVFASTLVLLAVSPLVNLSLWKDQLRSSLLSQETKINT
jgi:ribonucleotide reductase beta subunit family protein with ferritin-like domain